MPDIRSVLSIPRVYRGFWNLLGGPKYFRIFAESHVRPRFGARILDIGCGPGTAVPYFPGAEYYGIDISPRYIEFARRHWPSATFACSRVGEFVPPQERYFDIVLAVGIVHHLDDAEARRLFAVAHKVLRPNGRLVTLDGVFTRDQSRFARFFVSRDRGQYVRDEQGYIRIASDSFPQITSTVREDLSRLPYTHMIMECIR
jgi:SAM-dependent methyltransferase